MVVFSACKISKNEPPNSFFRDFTTVLLKQFFIEHRHWLLANYKIQKPLQRGVLQK